MPYGMQLGGLAVLVPRAEAQKCYGSTTDCCLDLLCNSNITAVKCVMLQVWFLVTKGCCTRSFAVTLMLHTRLQPLSSHLPISLIQM
jgi:hypothetical protein